jgi:putative lipoic acid-binding regulatory protein
MSAASPRLNEARAAETVARGARVGQDLIVSDDDEKRALDEKRSLDLLEANHTFPGDYHVTVIALNSDEVTAALINSVQEGLAEPLAEAARETRSSSGGKYLSHRMRVPCASAFDVIRLYARIRLVQGVVTVM